MSEVHTFTPEEIEDFKGCMDNPLRFMNHVDHRFQYSPEALLAMHRNRFTICKTDEMTGPLYVLHQACFTQHGQFGILAPSLKRAKEVFKTILDIQEALPPHIRPERVQKANTTHVEFTNGSKIGAYTTVSSSTKGRAFSLIYLDRFAQVQWEIAEHFWEWVFPCINCGTRTKLIINHGETFFDTIWDNKAFARVNE